MLVASELATSGSVMAKQERIRPSSSGSSHAARCSGVANMCKSSMLPVSGAEQLKISEAQKTRPMISASGAYSRLASRVPGSSPCRPGRNRFHRPSALASAFSGSIMEGGQAPASTSRCQSARRGTTCRSMKAESCALSCSTRGEYAKSMAAVPPPDCGNTATLAATTPAGEGAASHRVRAVRCHRRASRLLSRAAPRPGARGARLGRSLGCGVSRS